MIVLYIFLAIVLIGGIIYFVWNLENKLPQIDLPDLDNPLNNHQKIINWLKKLNAKLKFNGAVAYLENDVVLIKETIGYRTYKKKESLNLNTKFRLASVSKQFTAFGTMVLVKKHNLNYDDLVSKFIPNFPYKEVTIRHLLNQTSNINIEYTSLAKKQKFPKGYILTNEKVANLVCENPETLIKLPLENYSYNNVNYILLARIIEIVSNSSFEVFMKDDVFTPLTLNNTRVWNLLSKEKFEDLDNYALGFEAFLNSKPKEIKPSWLDGVAGDGAVFSSIEDLIKWDKILYENPLLNKEEMQEAFKKPKLNNGEYSDYGFGWVIDKDAVWHNGSWLASNTMIIRNTKLKTCFILLDNSSNLRFDKILKTILSFINIKKNEKIK